MKVGIAANYKPEESKANGNMLFIFCDSENNEICISIHISYSEANTNYLDRLQPILDNGIKELKDNWNFLSGLKPTDNFSELGYIVTSGKDKEADYKLAIANIPQASGIGLGGP